MANLAIVCMGPLLAVAYGGSGIVKLNLFGPSRDEIDQIAHDLIVVHRLGAYDEAVRLSEVVRVLPNGLRRSRL